MYVANSPLNYTDPTGEFMDTIWDAWNVIYDVWRWVKNLAEITYWWIEYGYASYTDNPCLKKQALAWIKQDRAELWEASVDIAFDWLATVTPFVPAGATKIARIGFKIEKKWETAIKDGAIMKVDDALTAAEDFLGKWYKELSNWRFVSKIEWWFNQVRMWLSDILGKHAWRRPHINFETFIKNNITWKMENTSNIHIFIRE